MEQKKKTFNKKWLIIIIIILIMAVVASTVAINVSRFNKGQEPLFHFSKTINGIDGSIIYNIFPYKIIDYRNTVNDERYMEISSLFKNYKNEFYNPNSPRYVFSKKEYVAPVFKLDKYKSLVDDVISKVNEDGFGLGTNSNYSNIYIETGLKDEDKSKLVTAVDNIVKTKYDNKAMQFTSLNDLGNKGIFKDNKIDDGIYIKVALLENTDDADIMSFELITNVSSVFSQKATINNDVNAKITYIDDFDQIERKEIEEKNKEILEREKAEKLREEEKEKEELAKKEKIENELKEQQELFEKNNRRLQNLLGKTNYFVIEGRRTFIESETIETIENKEKKIEDIKSYNSIKINSDKIIYFYQEQVQGNTLTQVYIKERQLSDLEFNNFIEKLDKLTGYSGIGKYQDTVVLSINYSGKIKNVLLIDINEIFKEFGMEI